MTSELIFEAAKDFSARLSRVRIVLVHTSHPGNIGAAARALATMGLSQLVLVAPKQFPDPQATARAAGAEALLEAARVVPTLAEALVGCVRVYGTTPKSRRVALPELSPRAAAPQLLAAAAAADVALLFGNERIGLTNDQIALCHAAVCIPTAAECTSLNLAQAVQLLGYELRMAALAPAAGEESAPDAAPASGSPGISARLAEDDSTAAASERVEAFFGHLQAALLAVDFFKGRPAITIMRRLRRIFLRAELSSREVLILRGILADVERAARLAGIAPRPLRAAKDKGKIPLDRGT